MNDRVGRFKGFTLAELLIALAILGVIATFTIPKVLTLQQDHAWTAGSKEAAAAFAQGHQKLKISAQLTTATKSSDMLHAGNLNYVKLQTTGFIDQNYGNAANIDCSNANHQCYVMHNGAVLMMHSANTFQNTAATSAVYVHYDPDGQNTASATGPGTSLTFYVFYNGRTVDGTNIPNPTCTQAGCWGPETKPPWFQGW